jgi:rhamnose utilization protein RhaD (predicted bifunctional aldolase and dehydrogenase)
MTPAPDERLRALVDMSIELGRPENDYSILAEGNTSTQTSADEFYVKASGFSLRGCTLDSFVACKLETTLALLDDPHADLQGSLDFLKVNPTDTRRPSVEVVLHALMLTVGGAKFVGHTHPSAINSILCSVNAQAIVSGRIFPDEVVLCGPESVWVPYTDPGLPLARTVHAQVLRFIEKYDGMTPKVILMQNHGLIALGQTAREVEQVTQMAVKAARIMLGTFAAGGPRYLSEADILHLWKRPDEIYRRAILK